jgi:hypothetical protein
MRITPFAAASERRRPVPPRINPDQTMVAAAEGSILSQRDGQWAADGDPRGARHERKRPDD